MNTSRLDHLHAQHRHDEDEEEHEQGQVGERARGRDERVEHAVELLPLARQLEDAQQPQAPQHRQAVGSFRGVSDL